MKQILWKLLIRYLFSEFRLLKSEVKLSLISQRFKMFRKDVSFGDVEEPIDESTARLQSVHVTLEKLIAFEDFDDFFAVFLHKRLVVAT